MNHTLDNIRDEFMTRENAWTLGSFFLVVAGAATGRALLKGGWRATAGGKPPVDPDATDTDWAEALAWAVVTGALVGVARALARKGASAAERHWS